MVNVYVVNCSALPDPLEEPSILGGFSEQRKQKIMRQQNRLGRKQSLAAGLLLQEVLFRYECLEKEVSYGVHGKPQIEGLYFNLSHSGAFVICAVGTQAVGCDIEKIKESPKRIAERFFGEKEQRFLNSVSETERDEAFFRIWTIKEAYVKMTGEGASIDFRTFDIELGEAVRVFRAGELQKCQIMEYCLDGYRIAVCSEEKMFADALEIIKMDVTPRE